MSDVTVEMKIIRAQQLERDHVFEMFGNLYQVDFAHKVNGSTQVYAHIIAQVGHPRLLNGQITISLSNQTPVSIEA